MSNEGPRYLKVYDNLAKQFPALANYDLRGGNDEVSPINVASDFVSGASETQVGSLVFKPSRDDNGPIFGGMDKMLRNPGIRKMTRDLEEKGDKEALGKLEMGLTAVGVTAAREIGMNLGSRETSEIIASVAGELSKRYTNSPAQNTGRDGR